MPVFCGEIGDGLNLDLFHWQKPGDVIGDLLGDLWGLPGFGGEEAGRGCDKLPCAAPLDTES